MDLWTRRRPAPSPGDGGADAAAAAAEPPVALAREGRHGPVIHGASPAAEALGARRGARVVDVRAAAPSLVVEPADPRGDALALRRLARWAGRWCPWVAADPPDGLVLDVTGAAHLFGGEEALLLDMEGRLRALGLAARVALAPSRGAAWALARFGPARAVCADPSMLDPLPVAALRLGPEEARILGRLGLKTVGALRGVPRAALMRRFSRAARDRNPLVRLDQALGRLPEPVAPVADRPPLRAVLRLAEAVADPAPLVPDLCGTLAAQLKGRGEGCRRLRLTICRVDGEARDVAAGLARPTNDARHMARLFRDRLEVLDPGFGFDAAVLEALDAERLDAAQPDLAGEVDGGESLARLVDELSARLGEGAVRSPVRHDRHVPERAQSWTPTIRVLEGAAAPVPPAGGGGDRPLVLFEPPEALRVIYAVPDGPPVRLEWRRRPLQVARHAGPERIAPEWWRDRPGTRARDYYRVEDEGGRRYWIFREGVAGDGRGGAPRWFMHGLFP